MTWMEVVEKCHNEISIQKHTRQDCEKWLCEKGLRHHIVRVVDGKCNVITYKYSM
jgi:hypothetical protein